MKVCAWQLAVAVLLIAVAVLLLAPHADAPQPSPDAVPEEPPPSDAAPVLRGSGPPAPAVAPEEEAPTETEWLAAWDPADGVPQGDDTLRGIVVDPGGEPIRDARVYLRTKPGQPVSIDDPATWNARTDRDGRWQIESAWAERSLLAAWAPGYERTSSTEIDSETEIRLVLEPAVPIAVTVRAPPSEPAPPFHGEAVSDPRIRVRLTGEGGVEFPRPDEALAATWDQGIELDTPTPLRIPRDVPAHVTADAVGLASDPAFVALPAIAKELVFQLRPSATIRVRLLDAATKEPLALDGDFWGFVGVTAADSGFELEVDWLPGRVQYSRGVAPGRCRIYVRFRGYLAPKEPPTVLVSRPGELLDVDVPLERDLAHARLYVTTHNAEDSQLAGHHVVWGGPTLLRRREDASPTWRYAGTISVPTEDGGERRTLGDLEPGTYDVLLLDAGRFPSVGHRLGVELQGGEEVELEIPLEEGYGFRPSDAVQAPASGLLRLRAQSENLGILPWLAWNGESAFHQVDAEGFAEVTGEGYVGPYPSKHITLVEQPRGGEARSYVVKPSISPPR